MDENSSAALYNPLYDTDLVASTIKDLRPSDIAVKFSFKLRNERPGHHRARRMLPIQNGFITGEIDDILEAGIIFPASPLCLVPYL